jgi:hypothetical protein
VSLCVFRAASLENVPNIVSMSNGLVKEQYNTKKDFENLGYKEVVYKVLMASNLVFHKTGKEHFFIGIEIWGTSFQILQQMNHNSKEAISV